MQVRLGITRSVKRAEGAHQTRNGKEQILAIQPGLALVSFSHAVGILRSYWPQHGVHETFSG